MLVLNKDKYIARNLELRSLRSWFKHLPLIHEFHNRFNDSEYYSYPDKKNQSNIDESIQKNYIDRPFLTFHRRFILRNVFESWKTYVIYKLRKRKALCEADHVYRKKLKRNIFNILSKNIIKSNEHYNTTIKSRHFKLWKKYTKVIQMNKSLVEKSRNFYVKTYLQKSITTWKAFVLYKKEKNMFQTKLIEKVSKLYNSNLLHKYFMIWISLHNSTKVFNEQLQMVLHHYNKKVLNRYFLGWVAYYNTKKQNKDVLDRADQQYRQKLLKRCLKQFNLYIDEVHVHKKQLEMANNFYKSKIMIKIFRAWVQWYYQALRIHNIMLKIQQIADSKIKQKIFIHWKLYVFHKKRTRRKISLHLTIYHKKIVTNAFVNLQNYVLYKKRKRTEMLILNNKSVPIIAKIQSMYIDKWKRALNVRMQEKCKIFKAIEFYNNYISRRYLSFWKKFSQQYKAKLLQKNELNERASCFLLNKCIMVWKLKCEENSKIYEKEKFLISVVHKKIQKKYFTLWERYRNQKMRKRRDIQHAKDINKKFALQEGLREILRHSLFTMQFHHENRLKYATSKSVEDFEILNQYFARWSSIIFVKENLKSLPLGRTNCCYHRDAMPPSDYTVNKSGELNTLFMNDTNNNLYCTSLCNDESISLLTNDIKLLPPSAFY